MIAAWFGIAGFMLIAYVVLDGRNFGAGMLHWLVARTPEERRQVIAAIGPLWSWHEVWLVGFGGTLLAVFPKLLASAFAGYYLALFLILWCLLLRGISLEVGGHINDRMWQGFWDFRAEAYDDGMKRCPFPRALFFLAALCIPTSIAPRASEATPPAYDHIVIVMEENKGLTEVIGNSAEAPYINGVLDANQPVVAMRFGMANEPLVIGADFPGGDEYFNGTIRDARVYGRALTGVEITALATVMAVPLGVLGGIYLNEYGGRGVLARVIRFLSEVMTGVPSVVMGIFIYTFVVLETKEPNAFAGALALACLMLPIVIRTTDEMLRLVPHELREGSYALGSRKSRTIRTVVLPNAAPGIISGALLAVARAAGETAPLLFTALNNQFWSVNMNAPMASLPVTIFQFALSPYEDWQQLAWSGALMITVTILILNIVARAMATIGSTKR
jgi:phosphate transport system permease protein